MSELIAQIILVGSLLGMMMIFLRKIPTLVNLPLNSGTSSNGLDLGIKKGFTKINPLNSFSFENFLQKILLRSKILTVKSENKISDWMKRLEKCPKHDDRFKENYWEEVKKVKRRNSK